ncbi:MAG: 2-oxoacid:ferredoxin oxidoreductase subunit beta [Deltaproteobacteria bacterium]|nr:2-oxoacid:ferredoxin oxidoreductase subunit beta [Deltaproteobacteria bacterium]
MHELSDVYQYLRWKKRFPTVWCAGCGIGSVMGAIIRAIKDLEIPKDDITFIGGIGCSSRMPLYLDFNTLHTTHGRALAFATGVKLHRPEMKVIVVSGDGDALAIGGNHFIHAARRNIDITLVLINNSIYGMTGGQVAPTTPLGAKAHTMPYGNYDPSFDPVDLALAAGASYVARGTVASIIPTTNYLKKALNHPGFSLVEIISQCPTQYGRLNKNGDPRKMLLWQKENAVSLAESQKMSEEEREGKIITGIFRQAEKPEYTTVYRDYVASIQADLEE